jgi:signal transduction histidine kinase
MRNQFLDLNLGVKISLLGVLSVVVTTVFLVLLAVWQSGQYNTLAQGDVNVLLESDLDHITQGVYSLVQTEDIAIQAQIDRDLEIVQHVLAANGGVAVSPEPDIAWQSMDQFTGKTVEVRVPRLLVGGTWPGQNRDPAMPTPVVDEASSLIGMSVTLFQRMDQRGDMLRVATTVLDSRGRRAIGTYIPAADPDGSSNPVIEAVEAGRTYHGRAFVVNTWHLTAYAPLRDASRRLVGMLYVGIPQKSAESRVRDAIQRIRIGQTGYVYILGGRGEERGRYIVSQMGQRDGEDVWDSQDSDGGYVVRTIVGTALSLEPGKLATVRYRWLNPGERTPRWKVARVAYYKPWDWVIGTSAYEDELQSYLAILESGRSRMILVMCIAGMGVTLLVGLAGVLVAWTITRPLKRLTRAVESASQGRLDQVDIRARDEVGVLAVAYNTMAAQLKRTLGELERFTYTVSHDLKSPLVTIRGYIGYVLQSAREGDLPRLEADMGRIASAAEKMQHLLDELLELSRIGHRPNPPSAAGLAEIVGEALELLAGPLRERGVLVEVDPGLPVVFGDRLRLREALQNLLDNAVKFVGNQSAPRVRVGMRCNGAERVFFVEDNGMGIEPRYLERVFNLFEKLDASSPGTGVGLAIVKRVMETHGGRVWAESEGAGRGSRFCFTLPAGGGPRKEGAT